MFLARSGYRAFTSDGGLNAFSVFVAKPFIAPAPDAEATACRWVSGEIATYYHDWRLELLNEEIIDCTSSGMAHQHAVDRIIARKVPGSITHTRTPEEIRWTTSHQR